MSGDERNGDDVLFFEWRRLDRVIKTIAKVHIVVIRKQTISTARESINYRKCIINLSYLALHMHVHSPALRQTRMTHRPMPDGDETAGQHIYSPTAE